MKVYPLNFAPNAITDHLERIDYDLPVWIEQVDGGPYYRFSLINRQGLYWFSHNRGPEVAVEVTRLIFRDGGCANPAIGWRGMPYSVVRAAQAHFLKGSHRHKLLRFKRPG